MEKFALLSIIDEYFQIPDYSETYSFSAWGQMRLLDSCPLAVAFARLHIQLVLKWLKEEMEILSYDGITFSLWHDYKGA